MPERNQLGNLSRSGSVHVDAWGRLNVRFSHSKPSKPQVRYRPDNPPREWPNAAFLVRFARATLETLTVCPSAFATSVQAPMTAFVVVLRQATMTVSSH